MLWLPFLCSCTSESSPCLPSAYTHSRCWCLSGMLSMKPKWFAESRLHESTSFVLTSSKISHLFSVFSPHVSPIVMLHHIDKLAWFATKLIFHRQPGQGGAFKYFKYSKFPPSHSGWEWYQLGTRRRVCKLLQGRQGRSSFEQGGKGLSEEEIWEHTALESAYWNGRTEGTIAVRSEPEHGCIYTSVLVWARSQLPKPISQQSLLPVLSLHLWNGSGREEPNIFQGKHTLTSGSPLRTNTGSVCAMLQVAHCSHAVAAEGPES